MTAYPIIGDLGKPFHLPECECDSCERWRDDNYSNDEKQQARRLGYDRAMEENVRLMREIVAERLRNRGLTGGGAAR